MTATVATTAYLVTRLEEKTNGKITKTMLAKYVAAKEYGKAEPPREKRYWRRSQILRRSIRMDRTFTSMRHFDKSVS